LNERKHPLPLARSTRCAACAGDKPPRYPVARGATLRLLGVVNDLRADGIAFEFFAAGEER
jgi:hypothetical protein